VFININYSVLYSVKVHNCAPYTIVCRQLPSMAQTRKGAASKNAKKDKCIDCSKPVLDKEHGLKCEVCNLCFHSKCQNVDEDACMCCSVATPMSQFTGTALAVIEV